MIVGFDLGRSTGIAMLSDDSTQLMSQTWVFKQTQPGPLLLDFYTRCVRMLRAGEGQASLVAFETLPPGLMRGQTWAAMWYGLRAVLLLVCEQHLVAYVPVAIAQWKSEAGIPARGRLKQGTAVEAVNRRLGVELRNDDEAVAALVALTAARRSYAS